MNSNRLWAKRWELSKGAPPRGAYLHEHLKDVHAAAVQILKETSAVQLEAFGLSDPELLNRFQKIVLLAAAIHDLGKANDHFQGMICMRRDRRGCQQGLRHEWGTILMMTQLREWLLPAVDGHEDDLAIAEWAVAGHHPAGSRQSPPQRVPQDIGQVFMGHPDFQAAIEWLRTTFDKDLGQPPVLKSGNWADLGVTDVQRAISVWNLHSQKQWKRIKNTPHRFLVSAAKLCLIAADVAGSAISCRNDQPDEIGGWIRQAFDSRPQPADLIEIANVRLGGRTERLFQTAVADSTSRVTLVKAG